MSGLSDLRCRSGMEETAAFSNGNGTPNSRSGGNANPKPPRFRTGAWREARAGSELPPARESAKVPAAMPTPRRRRLLRRVTAALFLFYLVSYIAISANGHYAPVAFGILNGPDNKPILAPKYEGSYRWFSPGFWDPHLNPRPLAFFYFPLAAADHTLWHTPGRARTLRYPIRNYFDRETLTYRDVDPR